MFQVQRVRGRLFEIEILVPPGLQLTSVGPAEVVESAVAHPESATAGVLDQREADHGQGQVLVLHLTPQARVLKMFSLRLRGQERTGGDGPVRLGLFSVRDGLSNTNLVSLLADRRVSFEVADGLAERGRGESGSFRQLPTPEATAIPKAGSIERMPIALLKSSQNPRWLTGRLVRHRTQIDHDTRISARVNQRLIEVRQDTELHVRHGALSALVVLVPLSRSQVWQVQGKETLRREELDHPPEGPGRFRLVFDPPVTESTLLTFRFQLPLGLAGPGAAETQALIPRFVFEQGTSSSTRLDLTSAPGVTLASRDGAWTPLDAPADTVTAGERTRSYRLTRPADPASGFALSVGLLDQLALPSLVVPRTLLRTVLTADHESRTRAWYWMDTHPVAVSLRLPDDARWIRARVDGRVTDQVEREAPGQSYRVALPAEPPTRPVLLEVEYQLASRPSGGLCPPPQLPDDAVLGQSLWEVRIPWTEAIVGVPRGWDDANDWYWDAYVWKRRPSRAAAKLLSWVAGSAAQTTEPEDELAAEEPDGAHGYLFGRAGKPTPLDPWLASRVGLIVCCSGGVLLVGFVLMFSRVPFRAIWVVVATLGLVFSAIVHHSALVLAVQSAFGGIVLTVLGFTLQGLVARARSARLPTIAPSSQAGAAASPSAVDDGSLVRPEGVGSDDSTAIRARASSTMDFAPQALVLAPDQNTGRGSRLGHPG